ncbi:MAG: peptide chain release factor N(5)-glutamine methyltransferase [Elusimicrobiota bacterium]|nr:peptide chain release factor N(5)-glutamine methyltransferase [Elusimicrobiota bacterium]
MQKKDWTILEILNWTTDFFNKKNIKEARLDAEVLLADVLNVKRFDLYLNFNKILKISEISKYKSLIKKRVEGIPVAYISKKKEFFGYNFKIEKNVLIPRPETELLVENVLDIFEKDTFFKFFEKSKNFFILVDICTGSGIIPITISKKLNEYKNNIFIYGIDISQKALEIAQQNIYNHHAAENVRLLIGDTLYPLETISIQNKIDIITCNPPYIKTSDLQSLEIEVKQEPKIALDGGIDGLHFYRKIIPHSKKFLKKDGYILFEISPELTEKVNELLIENNFHSIIIKKDYQNLNRVMIAKRG